MRDSVGAGRARSATSIAGCVEISDRLEEHRDAAASGQIGVDDGDVSVLAHRARQLAAERRRAGAAFRADEERDR